MRRLRSELRDSVSFLPVVDKRVLFSSWFLLMRGERDADNGPRSGRRLDCSRLAPTPPYVRFRILLAHRASPVKTLCVTPDAPQKMPDQLESLIGHRMELDRKRIPQQADKPTCCDVDSYFKFGELNRHRDAFSGRSRSGMKGSLTPACCICLPNCRARWADRFEIPKWVAISCSVGRFPTDEL